MHFPVNCSQFWDYTSAFQHAQLQSATSKSSVLAEVIVIALPEAEREKKKQEASISSLLVSLGVK